MQNLGKNHADTAFPQLLEIFRAEFEDVGPASLE
jgi:hypothetical protein